MPNKLGRAISLIQDLSGYRFRDENILLDAIDTTGLRVQQSNQRLALLGDSILKFIILDDWYPTGAGNDHVSRIGSNANLAAAARLHGIEACVFTHPGHRGPVSQATLSTTVEAIIGAVYLDSENDLNAVRAFMKALGLTILGTDVGPVAADVLNAMNVCRRVKFVIMPKSLAPDMVCGSSGTPKIVPRRRDPEGAGDALSLTHLPDQNALDLMTDVELTQSLSHLDEAAVNGITTIVGPFSVFQIDGRPNETGVCALDSSHSAAEDSRTSQLTTSPTEPDLWFSSPSEASSQLCSADREPSTTLNVDTHREDDGEEVLSSFELDEEGSSVPKGHVISDRIPRGRRRHTGGIRSQASSLTPSLSRDGMLLQSCASRMLIHHYANNMVHLMQPIIHGSSPFSKIYLPLAIAGSVHISKPSPLDDEMSPTAAVCHSLLSAAANNMQGLGSELPELGALACQHKQGALTALRSALGGRKSSYRELMVAILSLVSVDLLSGGIGDHWIHLEAARQLQASRHFGDMISHETRQLDSICKMLRLFASTALHNPEKDAWPGNKLTFRNADATTLSSSVEYLYGITRDTASVIMQIYRLAQMLRYYTETSLSHPEALLQACEDLSDELACPSNSFSTMEPENERMLAIARAQEEAFHAATRIYYSRSIQGCLREDLNAEQRTVLNAMNRAEDLKTELSNAIARPAPITWPAFIASCEAVGGFRQLWSVWWERVKVYHMLSYTEQFNAITRIWSAVSEDDSSTLDWRRALKTLNIRILPV
ncbi:hypothetical protein KC351_g10091 [Hortaea werneckii]|nr:hypothetical protein KC351_g10091 [Hortaea werneckii]